MRVRTRLDVIAVLNDFDGMGGGSVELVAWELGCSPGALAGVWETMVSDGVITAIGPDVVTGELMFRLTAIGHDEPAGDTVHRSQSALSASPGGLLQRAGRREFDGDMSRLTSRGQEVLCGAPQLGEHPAAETPRSAKLVLVTCPLSADG
jgi:hypothetical protein